MSKPDIKPEKINSPMQLMAAWFVMLILLSLIFLLSGCSIFIEDYSAHKKAKVDKDYLPWNEAKEVIHQKCKIIRSTGQGHDRVLSIVFHDGTYILTIQPEIDMIYDEMNSCGADFKNIYNITE